MKEEFTDACTHDGHNAMTTARWPLASGAKNLFCVSYTKGFYERDVLWKSISVSERNSSNQVI